MPLEPPPTLTTTDRRLLQYIGRLTSLVNTQENQIRELFLTPPTIIAPSPTPPEDQEPPTTPDTPTTPDGGGGGGTNPPLPPVSDPSSPTNPSNPLSPEQLRTTIRRKIAPVGISSLLGQAAQPQIPYVPRVTSLPSLNDPQSQNGSVVIFNNELYQFTGGIDIGTWTQVGSSAPPPITGERIYLQNRATAIYFGAAGVDGLLQANSPILPADFNTIGKILRYTTEGVYSTTPTETPTLEFKLKFDAATLPVALISFNPVQTVANTINMFWYIDVHIVVFGASTLEVFGKLTIGLTNTTTVMTVIGSIVTQSGINLGINHSLDLTVNMSTQAGGGGPFNNIQQRFTAIELLN